MTESSIAFVRDDHAAAVGPAADRDGRGQMAARKPVLRPVQHHPDAAGRVWSSVGSSSRHRCPGSCIRSGMPSSLHECREIIAATLGRGRDRRLLGGDPRALESVPVRLLPARGLLAADPGLRAAVRRPGTGAVFRKPLRPAGALVGGHGSDDRSPWRPCRQRRVVCSSGCLSWWFAGGVMVCPVTAADRHAALSGGRLLAALGRHDLGAGGGDAGSRRAGSGLPPAAVFGRCRDGHIAGLAGRLRLVAPGSAAGLGRAACDPAVRAGAGAIATGSAASCCPSPSA